MTGNPPVVAFDVTPMLGRRTGIGNFVAELWGALERLDGGPELVPYVLSRRGELGDGVPPRTRRLPVPAGPAVRWWARFGWPALDGRLRPATVVHGTNFVAPPSRRAVVLTVHDLTFHRFPELCSPDTLAYGRLVRRALRRGVWVHTHTEAVAAEIRSTFGAERERVRVVPPGVPALPEPGPSPAVGGPYVLVFGTVEPRKRPELAVAAWGAVAADRPDLRLVVAGGDGPARPALDAAVAALPSGVRERVVLAGPVDEATRGALFAGAEALLHTAVYEGWGFPVLEAMASGTPVVAVPSGAVAEAAGDAALLSDDLAPALASVVDDPGLRDRLRTAGKARAAAFTWEATAAGMAALYEEAAGA